MATISIKTQPMSLIVSQGTTVTFNVSGTSSVEDDVVVYQWLKSTDDGSSYTAVDGDFGTYSPTNTAYSFVAGITDTDTFYKVSLSSVSGSEIFSNVALLDVTLSGDKYARFATWRETGEQRFKRLWTLGYV
jgi:hypothetical protein